MLVKLSTESAKSFAEFRKLSIITGLNTFNCRWPCAAEKLIVVSFPITLLETIDTASHCVGFILPGIIELPGSFAGKIISEKPALGPDDNNLKSFDILFNEIAPRPHNSGHLTIESHSISQFGLLGDIISNKIINTPVSNKKALMKNLLGDFFLKKNHKDIIREIENMDNHFIKLYKKDEIKIGRKMGHITIITDDIENSMVKINNLID